MKKLVLLVTLFFTIGIINVNAQDAKPKKLVFAWVKQTMDELGLSKELQTKIEAFKKENELEQKTLKESKEYMEASEEDKKKKMGALLGKRQKTIYEMLSKEEQAKVDAKRDQINKTNQANGY